MRMRAYALSCGAIWSRTSESPCEIGVILVRSTFTPAPLKFAPEMMTIVPPEIGPCAGEMRSIRGCCASAAAQVSVTKSEARKLNVEKRLTETWLRVLKGAGTHAKREQRRKRVELDA